MTEPENARSSVDVVDPERLHAHLAERAGATRLTATPLAAVVRRADERRRRRRVVVGTVAAASVLVATVTVGVALVRDSDQHQLRPVEVVPGPETTPSSIEPEPTDVTTPDTTPDTTRVTTPATGVQSSVIAFDMVWNDNPIAADSRITSVYDTVVGDGPLVAWTREDNARAPEFVSVVSMSDDGVTWRPVATDPRVGVLAAAASSGRIVLLGYTPVSEADGGDDIVVKISDDEGATWRTSPLPVAFNSLRAGRTLSMMVAEGKVALDGDVIVAALSLWAKLDLSVLLADQQPRNHRFFANGIELAEPCEFQWMTCEQGAGAVRAPGTDFMTWSDLGISPDVVAAISGVTPSFVSTDASSFGAIDDGPFAATMPVELAGTSRGILAITHAPDGSMSSTIWRSDDGRSWIELGAVPSNIENVGRVGELYVASGWDSAGVWTSADGADWSKTPLDALLEVEADARVSVTPYAAAIDDHGVTLVMSVVQPATLDVTVIKDGVREVFHDGSLSDIRFYEEATDIELGHVTSTPFDNGVVRALGDATIDILDAAGNVRTTFTLDDYNEAMRAQLPSIGNRPGTVIVHSDDGMAWSTTSLKDLTGLDLVDLHWINHVDGAPVVAFNLFAADRPNSPHQQHVLVGGAPSG